MSDTSNMTIIRVHPVVVEIANNGFSHVVISNNKIIAAFAHWEAALDFIEDHDDGQIMELARVERTSNG